MSGLVHVPIPDVDKGKGDLRNIIGFILQKNDEGFYKVGTKYGVLQKLYCRSEFGICSQTFLEVADVSQDSEISLRTAATKHSVGSGQGFVRCSCNKNCSTNRCQCKKAMIVCILQFPHKTATKANHVKINNNFNN